MVYNFIHLFKQIGTKKYRLEIWENAPLNCDRIKPIYFQANYLLETKEQAREILHFMGVSSLSKVA